MLATIKSEIRKLFTIRFTYGLMIFSLLMLILFSFYVPGWQTDPMSLAQPSFLENSAMSAVLSVGLIIGLVSILMVTHEYRYNTIVYSLTANRSRAQVFLAKFLVTSVFSVFLVLAFAALSTLLTVLAVNLRGLELGAQTLPYSQLVWRAILIGWGYSVFAFIIATLIRSQVGSIAAMFLMPSTIEPLLGLLLKSNQVYLPYSALTNLYDFSGSSSLAVSGFVIAVFAYIVVGLSVSLLLFIRRDAN